MHRGDDGRVRSDSPNDWRVALNPWLEVFDQVVIVARVELEPRSGGGLVEGDRVSVVAVRNYVGAVGLLREFVRVRRTILAECSSPHAFYGGRLPGILASLVRSAACRLGAPFLANVVGDPEAVLRAGALGKIGRIVAPLAGLWMRRQVRLSDAALYVSTSYLQRRYPSRSGTLTMSRSNVDLSAGAFVDHPVIPAKSADGGSRRRIVAVGSQEHLYKGHDLLIRAIPLLRDQGIDVAVEIIGGGRRHVDLKTLANRLAASDAVVFHGHVIEPSAVRQMIDSADLFVMPSRTEGVPRALIEAMARAKPCLGSNAGGIPELLDPEAIFPSNDLNEMVNLIKSRLQDSVWLGAQSARNLHRARGMSGPAHQEAFSAFLTEFIARGRAR